MRNNDALLDAFANEKLEQLQKRGEKRILIETRRSAKAVAFRGNRELVSFCCNDYLNLSQHPHVKSAAKSAIDAYGVGSGASRLVTGNHPLFAKLEAMLAKLKGTEDCVIFGSGYLANLGIIPTLVGAEDLIVADELSHACLLAGSTLSQAKTIRFRHNDLQHVQDILRSHRAQYRHTLLVTDGVFSMDGDLAPIAALASLADRFDAWLLTDDAHGIGVLGDGRGSAALSSRSPALQMGTLSKAIGGYGAYLCASRPVVDLIRTRARTLIYSTGLPPASVAAAIAALEIIEREPALIERPLRNARAFTELTGLPEAQSPIVPVILGPSDQALKASQMLEAEGFLVTAIRPPTVPAGTARLRLTFTADHKMKDIEKLASAVTGALHSANGESCA